MNRSVRVWGGGGRQGGSERRIEDFVKIQKKNVGGGGGRVGCERRIGGGGVRVDVDGEVSFFEFVFWGGRVGGSGWGSGWGGQGGCERRIEVFEKINQKKSRGGSGGGVWLVGGVRVDVTEPGLEPTTSGLEKPALLSTRLNTTIAITKYESENYNIQTAFIKKKSYEFFF